MIDDPGPFQAREIGSVTRRDVGLGALTLAVTAGAGARALGAIADAYRPQVHYTPPTGFMNDPNGLIFQNGVWNLFYQYNPRSVRAGHAHWGHAVSRDLLRWQTLPMAIFETPEGQAYSGSAVHDRANTSGLFASGGSGIVAVYTRASPDHQRQELAFSADGGRNFEAFSGNPVLDRGTGSFRDPNVLWHAETARWIMAVAASNEHRILFYASDDLKRWEEVGAFGPAGVLGTYHECPDLVRMPVEGGGAKWVLFVSINPGAPQGGSAVQYFVGEFDGGSFRPDDAVTRFIDFGKDFYALQTWKDAPGGEVVAIAWLSNWQYCNDVPTGPWRGMMTLPRRLWLRTSDGQMRIAQAFVPLESVRGAPLQREPSGATDGRLRTIGLSPGAAIEVQARFRIKTGVCALVFANGSGERLVVGYDRDAAQIYIDRGAARGFSHRFFTDKFSATNTRNHDELELHLVWDGCAIEVLAFEGDLSGTALAFFASPPEQLFVEADGPAEVVSLDVWPLRP